MRYETTPHRMPGGLLCPASMTRTDMPNACPRGCPTPRFNMALADAAPSRLEVTYALLQAVDNGKDVAENLSAGNVDINAHWDSEGRTVLRLDVTRRGQTFHYTITVDGDL